ncbi:regulator of chromosome condensation 1/beta-lactamase-inhibitor protein II, partial [Baffinella frigidus]
DATVKCWGWNNNGQLGLGDTSDRGDDANEMGTNLPSMDLGERRTAVAVCTGARHTCALLDDAAVKCWGQGETGQLGLGDTADRGDDANEMGANLPSVDLGDGRTAAAVVAGGQHTCALLDDATVKCWGWNINGQLGQGGTSNRGDDMGTNLPVVDLGAGRTVTAVIAGGHHTCVLLDDATLKCWGYNGMGQLGIGDTANRGDDANEMGANLPWIDLGPGRTAVAVTAGSRHTCALLDDATVKCWGQSKYGQLGLGHDRDQGDDAEEMGANLTAVDLGAGRTAEAVTAGSKHTCALLDDATVKCWGYNDAGQLGLGDTLNRGVNDNEMGASLPSVDLRPGRTAVAVVAGSRHTCALLDDATVKCWGRNNDGQLGLGDTSSLGDDATEMGDHLPAV